MLRLSRKETARQGVTKEYRVAEERRVAESGKDGSQVAAKRDRLQRNKDRWKPVKIGGSQTRKDRASRGTARHEWQSQLQ